MDEARWDWVAESGGTATAHTTQLLDGSGGEAADEVTAQHDVDEHSRCCDQAGSGHEAAVVHGGGPDEVVQFDRHRPCLSRGDDEAEEEVVPDVGELEYPGDHEAGPGQWQDDFEEGAEQSAA